MLKVVEKYKVKIQPRKANKELKGNMVAWLNVMKPKANYKQNKKASKSLRETHGVRMIREMEEFIRKHKHKNKIRWCTNTKACIKMAKGIIEDLPKKWNPEAEIPYKDGLDHTIKRKEEHKEFLESKENVYNPDITERGEPEEAIRIFTKGNIDEKEANQKNILRKHQKMGKEWKLYMDGSCIDANTLKARAGIGIQRLAGGGKLRPL